ncbi:MAG: hypothetical protein ACFE9S_03200 [Candidatus Hermodarchaeota archaeon]
MEIQYGKAILHGIIAAVLYLVVPLLLFYFLELYGIMSFSDAYRIGIIVFGIIGIVIAILRNLFPEDTPANRLIRFGITVYSGIFLFYIFGGFEPGRSLGTYYIDITFIQVFLGLQFIAWLLLGSTIISGLRYLVEAIELRKHKEYRVKVKKEFKVSTIFRVLGIIASLVVVGYFGSIIYSGLNLKVNLDENFGFARDPGVNPDPDYSDDSIVMTLRFNVSNMGLYAINNVFLNAEIHTETTSNASALPWYTKIGGSLVPYQNTFHSFSQELDQTINVTIDSSYIIGLMTETADLLFKITFSTLYALIFINLTVSLPVPWTGPP